MDLRAPILVYPHHGGLPGAGTDPAEHARKLLAAVDPRVVIFSIGREEHANPNPRTILTLREALPNARIVCTQLSKHCAEQLSDHSPTHLSRAFARGRENGTCCGGTIVVPLNDPNAILPQPPPHQDFIRAHAQTALCC